MACWDWTKYVPSQLRIFETRTKRKQHQIAKDPITDVELNMPILNSAARVAEVNNSKRLLASIHHAIIAAYERQLQQTSPLPVYNGSRDSILNFVRALTMEEIEPIKALCDQLTAAHFQIPTPEPRSNSDGIVRNQSRNCIRYQHIYENELFSMGIFILPPGGSIPLHDHPDMSVISRVLYGGMHVKSCDIIGSVKPSPNEATNPLTSCGGSRRLARIHSNKIIHAPHTTELLPEAGNLHEFVADEEIGCAIFDILTPPYEPDEGRDCTYYRMIGNVHVTERGDELVELEEFQPHDFGVVSDTYNGPRIEN